MGIACRDAWIDIVNYIFDMHNHYLLNVSSYSLCIVGESGDTWFHGLTGQAVGVPTGSEDQCT